MSHPDAQIWNARYLSDQGHYLRRQPYPLVRRYADQLPLGGLALEVAAGAAPAGLFLARHGLRVIAMDISEVGLRLAQQSAREFSLPLSLVVMDMSDPWLPASKFDVVLNFYYLSRPLFERYRQALKPGGWLFFETFVQETHRRCNSAHYLESGELYSAFQDWEILHWTETWRKRRDGTLSSKKVAQLIARKTT
ncbi:MAG: class I SAM-dependent methyltransferase [Chloroflexi bacterium]|nr:class I SAM-dependent methyltransferase [Chloroflexota bacterium]